MLCPYCGYTNIPGVDLCERCGSDLAGLDIPEAERGFTGELMNHRLDRIPFVAPLLVRPDDTVAEAVELMRRERHGCVLVEDEAKLVGILTERDVLVRVVRAGLDPQAVRVDEVMTPEPKSLTPEDPPAFAIHRMVVNGFRHLPIVEGDDLKGFISVRNILAYIARDVIPGQAGKPPS